MGFVFSTFNFVGAGMLVCVCALTFSAMVCSALCAHPLRIQRPHRRHHPSLPHASSFSPPYSSLITYSASLLPPEFSELLLSEQTAPRTKAFALIFLAALPSAATLALTRIVRQGKISPSNANQLLRQGRAFLVDVRSSSERSNRGVPDLRLTARGRAATVELTPLPKRERQWLSDPASVERRLAAAEVLERVKPGEGIIVMGADRGLSENQAKKFANEIVSLSRFARQAGVAIMDGGFRAWELSGLRVCDSYSTNPAVGFAVDSAERAREQPTTSAKVVSISVGAAFFVLYAKPIMQASAFWGLLATAVDFTSYRITEMNDTAADAMTGLGEKTSRPRRKKIARDAGKSGSDDDDESGSDGSGSLPAPAEGSAS